MADTISFGAWLKRHRRQKDLTQKELAFLIGCAVGTVRKIEADERQPSRQLASLLAVHLDIPPEKHQEFIAFARSEPHIDQISFPNLSPGGEELAIPAVVGHETFGEWVQTRRNQLGYTRRGLAERVGCTPKTIRQIERSEGRPSLALAETLAAHLQISEIETEQFIFKARGEFVARYGVQAEISLGEGEDPTVEDEAPKHNLPVQTTPFFGRQKELYEITEKLGDPNCRLLTILAAGGMGKTRLSIEAVAAQIDNFTEGVTFVELAPVSADDSDKGINPLVGALSDALKFPFHGGDTPERQLFGYLQLREMLLVFDNFEHLLDAAEFVSLLLQNAPDIKVLITSRERLNLQEEWLFPLQGMSLSRDASSKTEFNDSDAVQLFAQRAEQVRPSFNVAEEYPAVLRICRLVEGMPLGLELAAAWVFQLSCQEIADQIKSKIDFLVTETRNVPDRHRSIRSVFNHSWEKLTVREREVLQKLSVFRGGFERQAAKAVANASLPVLASLTGKSLLTLDENGRYNFHELLRQFAAEKLAHRVSLAQEVQESHGRYFLTFERKKGNESAAINAAKDIDNVQVAIRWAASHQPLLFDKKLADVLRKLFEVNGWFLEAEASFRMIVEQLLPACLDQPTTENMVVQQSCFLAATYQMALCDVQLTLGRYQKAEESAKLVQQWLPAAEDAHVQALRVELLYILGIIKFCQGELVQALNFYQQAGAFYQLAGDQINFGWTLFHRNMILQNTGEFDAAEEHQNAFQQIAVKMNDANLAHSTWGELGKLATIRGQLDEAEAYFGKSLEHHAKINNLPIVAYRLREMGEVFRLKGDYVAAKNDAQKSIAIAKEIHMPYPITLSLWLLGNIAVDEGQFETALHYFARYERISTPLQEQIGGPGWALLGLGGLAKAREQFAVILQNMLDNQARPIGLDALVGMAHIKARSGLLEEALELLALVKVHPSSHFESREKAHKLWEELTAELPIELVVEAEARGRELDLMETAETLLTEGDDGYALFTSNRGAF